MKTTVAITPANKFRLDSIAEEVFENEDEAYNATIGYLATFYNNHQQNQ